MPSAAKTNIFLAIITIIAISTTSAHASNSLCKDEDEVYFSCSTKSKKLISLCKSTSQPDSTEIISYKFGTKRRVELEFSTTQEQLKDRFSRNHYFRYLTEYLRVNFTNNNYQYSLFKDYDQSIDKAPRFGVIVSNLSDPSVEHEISCASVTVDKLQEFAKPLPCNPDSALGCAAL
ncbi:hypothetical protein [Ralstonia sp. ASV6]|uniref:hypothetical protein n=1 Tax=Ralstonia sp. ASV6 TaxID=2795124 RepID=UPI0018ECCD2B|nr:hypothetical protein [Ralstonia sp. ASV6]